MATVLLPRHAVLIGDNNTGKTTLLEALDLVLGPDRLNRQPPIDEHDFFRGNYLAEDVEAAGVAVEDVGTDAEVGTTQAAPAAADDGVTDVVEAITGEAPRIEIEVTIAELTDEQKGRFGDYIEF